jgi:hypothetical protein
VIYVYIAERERFSALYLQRGVEENGWRGFFFLEVFGNDVAVVVLMVVVR